jgi:hypothetical protein
MVQNLPMFVVVAGWEMHNYSWVNKKTVSATQTAGCIDTSHTALSLPHAAATHLLRLHGLQLRHIKQLEAAQGVRPLLPMAPRRHIRHQV